MRLLIAILALTAFAQVDQAPAPCLRRTTPERPYSRVGLIQMVRDQGPENAERAEYLIRTCGVRIAFTVDLEADLNEVEATASVILVP